MSNKGVSLGWLGVAPKKWNKAASNLFSGQPEEREQVSRLLPGQEPLLASAINAGLKPGAGGAFGDAADYYRNNLSDNPADMNAFAAPEMRNFNENTIPQLSEQFAGMGSGGLSSSGFRNAAIGAGTDLSERLGSIRAGLRHSSAQGLSNIGQIGLGNFSENQVTQQGTPGLLEMAAPILGTAAATAFGGPIAGAVYAGGSSLLKNSFGANKVGSNSSPYGANQISGSAKPQAPSSANGFNLPNFMG